MKRCVIAFCSLFATAQALTAGCGDDAGTSGGDATDGATGDGPSGDASSGDSSNDAESDGGTTDGSGDAGTDASGPIKTVFVIMIANHTLADVQGNSSAPYYNTTLVDAGAHATNYKTPPGLHPDEPNYIWLESGDNLGITDDGLPADNHQATTDHLVTQLKNANISWKAYAEDIVADTCPTADTNLYVARHVPMVFFDDVAGDTTYCKTHVRPFTELATDLSNNSVARYNFIAPNICNDGTGTFGGTCPSIATDLVKKSDDWLAANVPPILASQSYLNGGAVFIVWDQGSGLNPSDGPLPLIVLSPKAKLKHEGTMAYTHGSTLRTLETIFGVPLLRDAMTATDLSDLFTSFP